MKALTENRDFSQTLVSHLKNQSSSTEDKKKHIKGIQAFEEEEISSAMGAKNLGMY